MAKRKLRLGNIAENAASPGVQPPQGCNLAAAGSTASGSEATRVGSRGAPAEGDARCGSLSTGSLSTGSLPTDSLYADRPLTDTRFMRTASFVVVMRSMGAGPRCQETDPSPRVIVTETSRAHRPGSIHVGTVRACDELGTKNAGFQTGTKGNPSARKFPCDRQLPTTTAQQFYKHRIVIDTMTHNIPQDQPTANSVESIMVCLDGSDASQRALQLALDLATPGRTQLHLVSIVDLYDAELYDSVYFSDAQLEELKGQIRSRILEPAAQGTRRRGYVPTLWLAAGRPGKQILKLIDQVHPTWVAVGKTGRNFVERMLEGSVSRSLVARAQVPVIVVP